ncbi:MAG: RAMP superfamily CRISPR-associated protein [Thermodesulfovibrionales bacterium]
MNLKTVNLKLSITFRSPFIVGSGFGTAGMIDLTTIKDNDNIVYIPGSSLKGKIRSEFKKNIEAMGLPVCNSIITGRTEICKNDNIKNACVICRIFGSEFYNGSLFFEDAVMDAKAREILSKIVKDQVLPNFQSSTRTGIKINRRLRTAEEGALFSLECVNPAITFTSFIYGSCWMTDDEYSYLKSSIEMITHIGGNKARGMGRCNIKIEESS